MDDNVLASQVVRYISAAVSAYGSAVMTHLDDVASDEDVQAGLRLLRDLSSNPAVEAGMVTLTSSHDDPDFQAGLRLQVKTALREDAGLPVRLVVHLPENDRLPSNEDRSISIGGNNSGPVSSGDQATTFHNITATKARFNVDNSVNKRRFIFIPVGFFVNITEKVTSAASSHPVIASVVSTAIIAGGIAGGVALSQGTDPLEGQWQDNLGNIVEFVPGDGDNWIQNVISVGQKNTCPAGGARITGSGGHYMGAVPFYSTVGEQCRGYVGDGTITIDIPQDSVTASVTVNPPAGNTSRCLSCGAITWTKQ
ncbi:hypothetical protein JOF56_010512 [Kibdelosporangium banguiense]|uniref:Uncharacterized protein n=1 Tax=Kibdelosporangium banguiense TaxID=1365924 RepID=A0ABS4U0F9_9PSEU|nr:hypothetical protein [Kibdelosporangium banguiense]MBP2330127.1 hypothetical protein [Kibdelosporangium banguiense]